MTVKQLIKLLDTKENCYGGATGKEREISISVNSTFLGYIESAEMDGHGDGLVTDVDLCVYTDKELEDTSIRFEDIDELLDYNEKLLNGFLSYLNKRHDKRRDVIHAGVKTLIRENADFAKEFNDYVKKDMMQ